MATYLITGVSRGLGFEFLRQISANPDNTIVGLVRNKKATDDKVKNELDGRENIHILEADLTSHDSLKSTVQDVSKITGGKLDYLIANAGLIPTWSAFDSLPDLAAESPQKLEDELLETFKVNTVGNIHLFNLFVPLVLRGAVKKVIAITTGFSDVDLTGRWDLAQAGPYSISKAAMNMAVAKFAARYAKDGVLFLSLAPGSVNTGQYDNMTPEEGAKAQAQYQSFVSYAPWFKGPITAEESIGLMLGVIERSALNHGDSGAFLSQFGNKTWL